MGLMWSRQLESLLATFLATLLVITLIFAVKIHNQLLLQRSDDLLEEIDNSHGLLEDINDSSANLIPQPPVDQSNVKIKDEGFIVDRDPSFITDMSKLKNVTLPHGSFYFGPDSHEVEIPESDMIDPTASWTPLQRMLIDDSDYINVEVEKKRCASYNFAFPDSSKPLKRRRLFYGALISGDSKEVIKATSMEQYNMFHTVSLIESNKTQSLFPKEWRFFGSENATKELNWLYQIFGPKTKVSVDYYVTTQQKKVSKGDLISDRPMLVEFLQREGHAYRWNFNGMRPDDVAIVTDIDETFSRDFLRALQICDIRQFHPGQTCREPKVIGSTLIFEGSPECSWKISDDLHYTNSAKGRVWCHPDAIIGECVHQIGDAAQHPPTKHELFNSHGARNESWGYRGEYSLYELQVLAKLNLTMNQGPLFLPHEVRMQPYAGVRVARNDRWKSPTGFHFHNFFMSAKEIRFKYSTYGHADRAARFQSLRDIDSVDLTLAVQCALGNNTELTEKSFDDIQGISRPIYYLNEEVRQARHKLWQDIVIEDEENYRNKHK